MLLRHPNLLCASSLTANYASRGNTHIWFYFTVWNTELISIYFLFAMTTSIIGFVYESSKNDDNSNTISADVNGREFINSKTYGIMWPSRIITFGRIVHILFQVCGGKVYIYRCQDFNIYVLMSSYIYISVYIGILFIANFSRW
jgi:hypothetical protein